MLKALWFYMKNKLSRIFVILIPLVGVLFAWATWEAKITPYVDQVIVSKEVVVNFQQQIDQKIANGEITKDEAIYIYKRNALKSNELEVELASGFKAVMVFIFLVISFCILATIIRTLMLEIKSDWKL